MPKVSITIDGQEVLADAGSTVLEAATAAGINIPTLCHHPALKSVGNCRMCLVEIERQRSLQASCVFPVSDGMVIHTHSDKVKEARKFVLELILSDHAFYCMYCEQSGDCELQDLAYEYGIDTVPYPYNYAWEPVDASREYFIFDPKRCILCRRCIRACSEIAANNTLGIMNRGFDSKIIADMNVPFGDSSCIACGTCLQVCPTGALTESYGAYRGRESETEQTLTTCAACGVGCGLNVTTRSNHLVRIQGDWDAPVNHGMLCIKGRFEQLDDQGERYQAPVIRNRGQLRAATWDEALDLVAAKLGDGDVASLASAKVTNEALDALTALTKAAGSSRLATLVGGFPALPDGAVEAPFADILEADFIVVANADLTIDHQVVASFVKRAISKGARLVVVDGKENGLSKYARMTVKPWEMEELDKVMNMGKRAANPIVLYGIDADGDLLSDLAKLSDETAFVKLIPGANTRGAYERGYGDVGEATIKTALVWAADDKSAVPEATMAALSKADFVILHAAYETPLADLADVILPAAIWAEKAGSLTNSEGRTQQMVQILEPSASIMTDVALLGALQDRLA